MQHDTTHMVPVEGGVFHMGDDEGNSNECPRTRVFVQSFCMDIHPVTNSQFRSFLTLQPQWRRENVTRRQAEGTYLALWDGSEYPSGLEDHAVINVSWFAAVAYASWAGKRLPTEAEWEFAAGGPSHTRYGLGDTFSAEDYAFALEGDPVGFRVCQNRANGYGLYDMCGGVWEWTFDFYEVDAYKRVDPRNPVNNAPSNRRTLRGGASSFQDAHYLRCSVRGSNDPSACHEDYGFRCAANIRSAHSVKCIHVCRSYN